MKQLYLKKFKDDISNLKELQLDKDSIVDLENTEEKRVLIIREMDDLLNFDDDDEPAIKETAYKIFDELPKEKDEQGKDKIVTVGGYIEFGKKPDKVSKVKKNDSKLMASLYGITPVLREMPKHHKVIGYVKIDGDTYLGVIKHKMVIVPILFVGLTAVVIVASTPNTKSPIDLSKFIQGEVGQGDIVLESNTELQEAVNLRIIMNMTPVLENGTMNLLISNNKDSNTLSMVAEVTLLSKLDDKGNIIETYKKPIEIAETPLLRPGDKIENVPVYEDAEIEPGRYDGRVMYTAYEITEEGAMPIGQTAGRISLTVKGE